LSGCCQYCAALQTERLFSLVFLPEGQITGIIMDVANVTKELFRLELSLKPKKQFPTSYNKRDLFWLCSNSFCTVMTKILKVSKFQKQIFFLFSFPQKKPDFFFLL
jgi:hypothetical protein